MSEPLQFTDFNFKLLVIDELMYFQGVLKPRFDLRQYADDAGIHLEEHLGETIDAAREYFERLEIPEELAENVEALAWEGGNEVYAHIAYLWSGEDDRFDVKSVADAEQFPNLESITLIEPDLVEGIEELKGRGVKVLEF